MNANARPVSLPWQAGWCFNVGAKAFQDHSTGPAIRFRALATPGDIAPMAVPAPWTFTLGLSARRARCMAAVHADGYRLEFPWDGKIYQVVADFPMPGVMVGYTDAPLVPSLFAPRGDVKRSADADWWESDDEYVALVRMMDPRGLRYALATSHESHAATMARARAALQQDAASLFEESVRLRQTWYDRVQTRPFGAEELCIRAVERLWANAELPVEPLPYAWCATTLKPCPTLDVDDLFVLAAAWTKLTFHLAEDLVRAVFSLQRRDGALPCQIRASGSADYSRAPLPLLAQTTAYVARASEHPEFARAMIGPLKSYLEWALNLFDPEATGIPQPDQEHPFWTSSEHGLIPCPVGLALMLLTEIEAFDELANMARSTEAGAFLARAETLKIALDTTYWQPDLNTYTDLDSSGKPLTRHQPSAALLSLRSGRLSPAHREAVRRHLEHRFDNWAAENTVFRSWCALILETLRYAEVHALAIRYSGTIWRSLQDRVQSSLPSSAEGLALDTATAGLLLLLAIPSSPAQHAERRSAARIMDWCNAHAPAVIGAVLAIPVLIVLSASGYALLKKTPPVSHAEVSVALAHALYATGNYKGAIDLYEKLLRTGPRVAPLEFFLGKAYFRAGDFANAEKCFRATLAQHKGSPVVMLNLALTLYHQGQMEESRDLYAQVAAQYADHFPEMARRAEFMYEFLKSRSATTNNTHKNTTLM